MNNTTEKKLHGNMKDLTGQKFGRLTAIEDSGKRVGSSVRWLCRCDCGNLVIVSSNALRTGNTKSCGCLQREWATEYGRNSRINLTGQRFGRLTVVRDSGERRRSFVAWLCKCDCGNSVIVGSNHLKDGHSRSCGCLQRELTSKRLYKHGDSIHPRARLYTTWAGMKKRCYNPNAYGYEYYGGKGIRVCDEWFNDYEAFRDWAFDSGYDDSLCIDRIDPDSGYYPGNCQWLTNSENSTKAWRQWKERRR